MREMQNSTAKKSVDYCDGKQDGRDDLDGGWLHEKTTAFVRRPPRRVSREEHALYRAMLNCQLRPQELLKIRHAMNDNSLKSRVLVRAVSARIDSRSVCNAFGRVRGKP